MLLVLMIVFSIASPIFLSWKNILNIARQISMLSIVAVGMSFVLLAGGIDLSVGSQISIIGVAVSLMIVKLGMNPVMACILGLIMTTMIGFFNGFVITKTKIAPLIATLAMQTILQGVSYIICGGLPVYGLPKSIKVFAQGYIFGVIPIPVVIMLFIVAIGAFILNKTYLGRYFYAVGSNEEATRLSGINTDKIRIIVYTLCGLLSGMAGIIMLGRVSSGQPVAGVGYEMDVLTAIVLGGVSVSGGKGKISGAFIGVLIIGVLSNGMSILGIDEYYQLVIKGVVLLLAVIFDSLQLINSKKKKVLAE
jgi:ribose transport system permease protein